MALMQAVVLGVACYDRDDYDLSPTEIEKALRVEVADSANGAPVSTLPADGFSRLTLVASIDRLADANRRTLTFTTSAGTLFGGVSNGPSVTAVVDAGGHATVELQSAAVVQEVRVRVELKEAGLARELALQFGPVTPDSVIRFIQVPATLPADQGTTGAVIVQVAAAIPASQRMVNFTTSNGNFIQSGAITPLVDNSARIDLRGPMSLGTARIQASIAGFARDTVVTFIQAPPDTILLDVGLSVKTGAEIAVTARLLRAIGTATQGTTVLFDAVDANGLSVGFFRAVQASNTVGQAQAIFAAVGVSAPSTVTLRAQVSGSTRVGTTQLLVVP